MKLFAIPFLLIFASSFSFAQNISGSWSVASSTGFTRRAALAAAVVNNKIYAMGGYNDSAFLNTLEVFDPSQNQWKTPSTTGVFTARRGLCAAVIKGKIYAIGGFDGKNALNTLEVYDPSDNTWQTPKTTGTFTAREKLCCSVV